MMNISRAVIDNIVVSYDRHRTS